MTTHFNLPQFESYGDPSSSNNYGVNSLKFVLPHITVWFSYKTPIAFYTVKTGRVVRENEWGPTTGKHLNWIDRGDKESRVCGITFEGLYQDAMTVQTAEKKLFFALQNLVDHGLIKDTYGDHYDEVLDALESVSDELAKKYNISRR